jgi:hypothetical protein
MNYRIKLTLLLLFTIIFSSGIDAQKNFVKDANRYKIGGMGYLSLGYTFNIGDDLKQNLNKTAILNGSLPSFGYNFGGGAYILFARKFIISGNGFALNFQNTINKSNEMSFKGSGGDGSFGYLVFDRSAWMVFPSIGVGGMLMKMNIRNTGDSLIYFGDYELDIRTDSDFELSQTYMDISVNAYKLIRFNNSTGSASGLTFGMNVGYIGGLGEKFWKLSDGTEIGGLDPNKFNSIYIKISVGGGIFRIR